MSESDPTMPNSTRQARDDVEPAALTQSSANDEETVDLSSGSECSEVEDGRSSSQATSSSANVANTTGQGRRARRQQPLVHSWKRVADPAVYRIEMYDDFRAEVRDKRAAKHLDAITRKIRRSIAPHGDVTSDKAFKYLARGVISELTKYANQTVSSSPILEWEMWAWVAQMLHYGTCG